MDAEPIPPRAARPAALAVVALAGGFGYDDNPVLVHNPRVHGLSQWTTWFTKSYWHREGFGIYRPLILASHGLTGAAMGPKAWVFHLTNLLAHALATALVMGAGRRIGLSAQGAILARSLFAAHAEVAPTVALLVAGEWTLPGGTRLSSAGSRGAREDTGTASSRLLSLAPLALAVALGVGFVLLVVAVTGQFGYASEPVAFPRTTAGRGWGGRRGRWDRW